MIIYKPATAEDIPTLSQFTDYWLAGRGKAKGIIGASNDCFISKGQHAGYIKRSTVLLAFSDNNLIGWAVKHHNGTLIHMLVAAPHRGEGIGKEMLNQLMPPKIRSKTDQSTGNPTPFYQANGYEITGTDTSRPSRKIPKTRHKPLNNITILTRKTS